MAPKPSDFPHDVLGPCYTRIPVPEAGYESIRISFLQISAAREATMNNAQVCDDVRNDYLVETQARLDRIASDLLEILSKVSAMRTARSISRTAAGAFLTLDASVADWESPDSDEV